MNRLPFILLLTLLSAGVLSQERLVTGKVMDSSGEPLIGATIVVQTESGASTTGTSTNFDGAFSMNVPAEVTSLLVSYVGYESKTIDIRGKNEILVTLEQSALQLEDVVVTALGIRREKKALGYAFSDVDGDELTTNRDVNFINSISNKIAGVNITQTAGGAGTSSRIMIRGIKSLSTESQPLIVIDGVPIDNSSDGATWLGGLDYGNSLMGIAPDDIETMSVLKGPNAAALYGSRAARGAIIITTKKGGTRDGKLRVTVNSNLMFDRAYTVAKYQNQYGAGFGGAIQKQALSLSQQEKYGIDSAYYYYSTGSWGPVLDGSMEVLNWNGEFTTLTPQPDNVKDYFNNGHTLTNSISIDKGTEKLNWRFSVASVNNEGLKPNSRYDRKSLNYNMNSQLNKNLGFSFKGNYIREDAFNRVGQGDSRTGARTFIWMPRSININTLREDYKSVNGYEQNWYFSNDWHTNPYWEAFENYNNDNKDQFQGFAKLDLNITSWLKGYIRSSMDTYGSKRYLRIANNALRANGEGSYTERRVNYRALNHDFLLTANKSYSNGLEFNVNTGGAYETYSVDYQSTTINGLAVPNFFSLNNPKYPAQTSAGTSKRQKVIQALYGSASVSFKSWLFLELTARNDWSSSLPVGRNSYFYPSLNTSFIFSDAFGLEDNILSFGKVRFSIASVGNDSEPHMLSSEYINQSYGVIPAVYLRNRTTDPLLGPEQNSSWEVGTDLRFFMNRLTFDITYYDEVTYNQILTAELSKTSGFASILTNGGAISNKGLEIQSSISPVRTSNFEWTMNLNFSKNKNEVEYLKEGLSQFTITNESQIDIVAIPGRPYGEIIGTRLKRYYKTDDEGNILDDPNNGKPMVGDDGLYIMDQRGVIGNITPDWMGGLTNMMRYKDLSLSFSIGVSRGGNIFSKTNKYGLDNGQFTETLEGRASWYAATNAERLAGRTGLYNPDGTPMLDENEKQMFDPQGSDPVGYVADGILSDGTANTKGVDPQVYFHQRKWGGIAELDVYDASYVKLRDVTINYNFPSAWFESNFITSASIALVGRNLWLIYSGVPNIDPESSFTSKNNGLGQEYAAMPTTRSVGFNLKVAF